MKKNYISLIMLVASFCNLYAQREVAGSRVDLFSPDKQVHLSCYQKEDHVGKRTVCYSLHFQNKPVVLESVMDLQLDNNLSESAMALKVDTHQRWMENLVVKNIRTAAKDTTWNMIGAEQAQYRDHYNTAVIELFKDDNPIYQVQVELRAYNEGAAFRFIFPENEKGTYYRVVAENTEFTLPEGTLAWYHAWAQAPYNLVPLSGWTRESERPLTLQLPNGVYAALTEAQMVDYSRTKFKLHPTKANTLVTSMHDPADLISPFATPWRAIILGSKPGDLIERNFLVLNLNEPNRIKDPSFIRPGKIIRVMTQTTQDAMTNIDFAAAHNLQYILFDWKWYGPAFSFASDATKVAIPNFDLPGIIQYGKERGVGVWLYVNQQALLAQSDSLFAVYKKWGVKGVKFGFVQVGSHRWTTWLESVIKKAAEHGIMVNIHDDWRPTGEQRTWPNLVTAEGIRGNEEMPDATHNTVLPFTRYLAGTADYTICYFDKRIKTTHAHQLAMAAVYFSPLQTLFWYDKPAAYTSEPELEFWENIPTIWDETKVLQGEPGQFITTARRSGEQWFVGTLTNTKARNLKLPFSFLPKGKKYTATIYFDDPSATTKTKVGIKRINVNAGTLLDVALLPSGGQAVWIKPAQ